MKLLFVKHTLAWPRSSGHDVHTFHMMKACAQLGHCVALATVVPLMPEAVEGVPLCSHAALSSPDGTSAGRPPVRYTRLQERYRSYWGVGRDVVSALSKRIATHQPDAVIVVGLDALTYLPAVPDGVVRVWYAADEWVWHHVSLVQPLAPATWQNLTAAAVKGAYERVYAPLVDRAWVVSSSERRAMRWFAGVGTVDVLPNGVDGEHYRPVEGPELPASAVFWGRLDFEPNVQGLTWFCRRVWPALRSRSPHARFTIIGFRPTPEVAALAGVPGVELKPDLPDLRGEVSRHSVVVLPFVSGGGIKNKLLEAAAMAKPIVCTPRAATGLRHPEEASLVAVSGWQDWTDAILRLWTNDERRRAAGAAARAWVVARHSWTSTAADAMAALAESVRVREAH